MNTNLFFLRSSEHKIAANIFPITGIEHNSVYMDHFGFLNTDIGIYSLTNNELSGAAWIRLYKQSDGVSGYFDDTTPVLVMGVIPNTRGMGIGSLIMEQLLQEAGAVYEQITVSIHPNSPAVSFYKRFGFVSIIDSVNEDSFIMVKKLEKKVIMRPTDGYDPRRWMD